MSPTIHNRSLRALVAFAIAGIIGMLIGLVVLNLRLDRLHSSHYEVTSGQLDTLHLQMALFADDLAQAGEGAISETALIDRLAEIQQAIVGAEGPGDSHAVAEHGLNSAVLGELSGLVGVTLAKVAQDGPPSAAMLDEIDRDFRAINATLYAYTLDKQKLRTAAAMEMSRLMQHNSLKLTSIGIAATLGSLLMTALFAHVAGRERRTRHEKTVLLVKARAASRAKDEFIAVISHELRTPLTSIKGALSIAESGSIGTVDAGLRSMLSIARRNADRLAHMVDDLLDLEKARSGKMSFDTSLIDLDQVIGNAVEENADYASARQVRFEYTAPDRPIWVNGDSQRLAQVAFNLMSNAAKFSPNGAVVRISMRSEGGVAVFSVADNGSGIPAEFRDQVFERFTQADSSNTRAIGGSGLGLNISKAIVQFHGGTISYDSVMGRGTTFHVRLPQAQAPVATQIAA